MPVLPQANLLGEASSPYLRQHAHNPVHWRAWGPEALAEAQELGRPILLSIGYAACHWCHVMAHESFEDPDTAALMNSLYVNIKVDREERPDIDALYMNALHLLGEQGGWPLTMFLTPRGEPFWGGTYFPPEPRWGRPSFRQVLQGVADAYRGEGAKVAQNVTALRSRTAISFAGSRWASSMRPTAPRAGCRVRRNSPTRRSSVSCGRCASGCTSRIAPRRLTRCCGACRRAASGTIWAAASRATP